MDEFLKSDSLEKIQSSLEDESGIFHRTWAVGQNIGHRFEVTRILGKGRMGRAYQVKDAGGRSFVIKTIAPRLADHTDAATRLAYIAKRLSNVKNPHVAPILEVGRAGGLYFLRSPYYKAPTFQTTFANYLEEESAREIPPAKMLQIVRTIADACAAVGFDLPHLDLAPRNLIVGQTGLVVADAGLAFVLYPAFRLRNYAEHIGSTWCAPEVDGSREPTAAADVYTLGKIVYSLVTKTPAPEKFERVPLLEGYPEAVEQTLLHACAIEPVERMENLAVFADALAAAMKGARAVAKSRAAAPAPVVPAAKTEIPAVEPPRMIEAPAPEPLAARESAADIEDIVAAMMAEIPAAAPPQEAKPALPAPAAAPAKAVSPVKVPAAAKVEIPQEEPVIQEEEPLREIEIETPAAASIFAAEEVVAPVEAETEGGIPSAAPEKPAVKEIIPEQEKKTKTDRYRPGRFREESFKPIPIEPLFAKAGRKSVEDIVFGGRVPKYTQEPNKEKTKTISRPPIVEPDAALFQEDALKRFLMPAVSFAAVLAILGVLYLLSLYVGHKGNAANATDLLPAATPSNTSTPAAEPAAVNAAPAAPLRNTLTSAEIRQTIASFHDQVEECFGKGLKNNPKLVGAAQIIFTVQPSGAVSDAVVMNSSIGDATVDQCLRRKVLQMRFPSFRTKAMALTYSFQSKP